MGGGAWWGISKPFLVLSVRGLEARALARQCKYHPSFIAPGTVRHEKGITTIGHRPLCVYYLSTWCNCTWPNLPGLPPPYSHTVSDQILEVGMAWERGYVCVIGRLCSLRKLLNVVNYSWKATSLGLNCWANYYTCCRKRSILIMHLQQFAKT